MSHVIGILGKNAKIYNKAASALMHKPFFVCNSDFELIISEQNSKNIIFNKSEKRILCFSGVPIISSENKYSVMDSRSIDEIDKIDHDFINKLNGHFCGFEYQVGKSIRLFNDLFSYKSLYYCLKDSVLIFSDRLDYVSKISGNNELNHSNCGSLWLLQNNFSQNSPFANISKLKPAEIIEFDFKELKSSRKEFNPNTNDQIHPDEVLEQIIKMLRISTDSSTKSIALSGGLDSRFLMSILLNSKTGFSAFSLGNLSHPDNYVAKQICNDLNVEFKNYDPDYSFDLDDLKRFAGATFLTFPISEYLQKKSYESVFDTFDIIFDGGIAEIARRGFYNNLMLRYRSGIKPEDSINLLKNLKYYHADIFSSEVNSRLESSAISDIENQLKSLPQDLRFEDKLDLLALRVKLPNYAGIEQSRLDEYGINITPFVQVDFLKMIFQVQIEQKKNAKMFKNAISKYAPSLKEYPLVKGNLTIPYLLPTLAGKILGKTKKKLNLSFDDSSKHLFVSKMKEYTYDTINSAWAKSDNMMDRTKAQKIADEYYKGITKSFWEMDWLLTYLIFKESTNL